MITICKSIKVENTDAHLAFQFKGEKHIEDNAVFMDLEHYIYKVPICIGVFGACIYDRSERVIQLTQHMIQNEYDKTEIINLAYQYLKKYSELKKYIVTFSGNNDFGVIDYLFKANNINFNIRESFVSVDLQSEYEKMKKINIGLKNLEKEFDIQREGELITGYELAKIIRNIGIDSKVYSQSVCENILSYNEQDVVNLFKIMQKWNNRIKDHD